MRSFRKCWVLVLSVLSTFAVAYSQLSVENSTFGSSVDHIQIPKSSLDCEVIFEPIPNWVKFYPKSEKKANESFSSRLIHNEIQFNHPEEQYFNREFYYIATERDLTKMKEFCVDYEPDYQALYWHHFRVYRKGKMIDLSDSLITSNQYFGKQIKGEHYADDARLFVTSESLEVGDLLELAYSEKGIQSDIEKRLILGVDLGKRRKDIIRILGKKGEKVNHFAVNAEVEVHNFETVNYSGIELIFEGMSTEERQTILPSYSELTSQVYFVNASSWASKLNNTLNNYELSVPPSRTVKSKTQDLLSGIERKENQIKATLDFVQEIEYLDYELVQPKDPETVLRQEYGDCKSKSLLGIKMLECIGIDAWPVLVKSGGYDERFLDAPIAQYFDHVVLEFAYESDTILFDATGSLQQGSIYDITVPDFRYGLRVIEGTENLTKFECNDDSKVTFTCTYTPFTISGLPISRDRVFFETEREIKFEGRIANQCINRFKKLGQKEIWSKAKLEKKHHPSLRVRRLWDAKESFTYATDRPECCISQRYMQYVRDDQQMPYEDYFSDWLISCYNTKRTDFIRLKPLKECEINYKIVLKDSMHFVTDTFSFEAAWLKFSGEIWQEGDTIFAHFHAKPLKTYFPDEQFSTKEEMEWLLDKINIKFDGSKIIERESDSKRAKGHSRFFGFLSMLMLIVLLLIIGLFLKRINQIKKIKMLELHLENTG